MALGHRRLSIIDLSAAGHQPMVSASGRYVIVFNGEIYNHLDLRNDLQGIAWRGHSATETLLAAVEAWGLPRTLARSVGMFAFALWDQHDRVLTLAHDRLGEKPLYYGWQRGVLLFGSELKALKAHPAFVGDIDRDALALYVRHKAIPAPHSIYKDIHKLTPGCYLQVGAKECAARSPRVVAYWSARAVAETGQRTLFAGTDDDALDLFGQSIAG